MKIKILMFLLFGFGFSLIFGRPISALAGGQAPRIANQDSSEIIPGELVVGMQSRAAIQSLRLPENAQVKDSSMELTQLHSLVIKVPEGQETAVAQVVRGKPGVLFVEPNYRVHVMLVPDDPFWSQQYGPNHIQAPAAWDTTAVLSSISVAVIDSGIDSTHPEFTGRILPGHDFVDGDNIPQDGCGHGTHVSGIIAAEGNNNIGIAGIAWHARIMPLRVLSDFCTGSTANVAEALVWAAEHGAKVINLSLGTSIPSTLLESGTHYAYTHGAAIFAAAGNSGTAPVFYPAAYPWVMAIGATDELDARAAYSNTGAALDLVAPGSNILSTTPLGSFYYQRLLGTTSQYGTLSGTSMAAAHASGAAALLASHPEFDTPDKIYQALTSTALDLDAPGWDDNTGFGLIQVAAALKFSPNINPTSTPQPPAVSYALLNQAGCGNLFQYSWRDGTTGSFVPVFGNDNSATVSLPFSFVFAGKTYASVTISANGYMTFDGDGSISDNFIIPSSAQPNNFIAPFWDDLNPSAGGFIYQKTIGTAPNREYVVEWYQVPIASVPSALTFEVILQEGTNNIIFQYHDLSGAGSDGSSASVGLEYADGAAGVEYSYNQAGAITPHLALMFMPYATGSSSPANNCSAFTRIVGIDGGLFKASPFCVSIPQNSLQHPAVLQIRLVNNVPSMPPNFLDLKHYVDISLNYTPPPPISPFPEMYVCYHYNASDVLKAGGHPENLFITAYNASAGRWDALSTSADVANSIILARIPHLSYFGVATLRTGGNISTGAQPITGAGFAWDTASCLPPLLALFLIVVGFVLWRKRAQ